MNSDSVNIDVSDLVGRPWCEEADAGTAADGGKGFRCYALAREVLRRYGVEIPADQAELLTVRDDLCWRVGAGEPCLAGDVLVMRGPDELQHLGVCISGQRFIHATRSSGVCIQQIARFLIAGQVVWVARPKRLGVSA